MASFGIQTTIAGVSGLVQNVTTTGSAEIAQARDEDGTVSEHIAYSTAEEISAEWIGTAELSIGAAYNTNYIISAVSTIESNTDYVRQNFTAVLPDSATITT